MRGRRVTTGVMVALLLVMGAVLPLLGAGADDEVQPADPFGPPEGPIPFPIVNVSSSWDEDRFPAVLADDQDLRVIWNKGARDMFVYHVVQRWFDGEGWQDGEDWVSVEDPQDQDFVAHEHYSHEGMAVRFGDLVYFVFASDDQNYTTGPEHDIVLRTLDPDTGRWGPIVEVTPNDEGEDREPRAAVFQDWLVIVWRTNDPGKAEGDDDDFVLRTYDGAAFSDIVPVSPEGDGSMDAMLDLQVVKDRLCMVWGWNNRTNGASDWDVLYREWDGEAFTSLPVQVSPSPARVAKLPRIATLEDDAFVVWESRPAAGEPGAVGIRGRVMEGTTPGQLVEVTRPGSTAENVQPEVVATGDMVHILWSSFDDSLTHGPDSDIVMRSFDGEELGEVVEISHPRDGSDVNEGFVTACVFQDNLYAVWRMMYHVELGLREDVNEDIVIRRVTDYQAEVEAQLEENPLVGDEVPLEVRTSTFWGAPVDLRDEGVSLRVRRGDEMLPDEVPLAPVEDGTLGGTYVPEEPGTYSFLVIVDGREMASTVVSVHGAPDENGSGDTRFFIYYTVVALALLAVAVVLVLRRR